MSLSFHACPPPGEWLNDPNGLVHADGAWRLFVQHRADGPRYRATGWARLTSANRMDWNWDGAVIPPNPVDWAYSGSVRTDDNGLTAVHTAHDVASGLERQVARSSSDAGLTWSGGRTLIEAARDIRDPFIGEDGMLLARPSGWDAPDARSQLGVWRETSIGWHEVVRIGPWHPPGVMWEVPVLLQLDGRDLLLISTVDRRGGGADCAVHGWAGALGPTGFIPDSNWPPAGRRIDFGPDFYAAMAASDGVVVAWLSSWATARTMPWPGFAGGPISLPRVLSLDGNRVSHHVYPSVDKAFAQSVTEVPTAGCARVEINGNVSFLLTLGGQHAAASFDGDPIAGCLTVQRDAAGPLAWKQQHCHVLTARATRRMTLFVDGPATELFIEPDGVAVSLALPVGGDAFEAKLTVDGEPAVLAWFTR